MAMSGMGMMLKSMGMDPDAIQGQVEEMKAATLKTVQHFDARLTVIDQKQDNILQMLTAIAAKLNTQEVTESAILQAVQPALVADTPETQIGE